MLNRSTFSKEAPNCMDTLPNVRDALLLRADLALNDQGAVVTHGGEHLSAYP